MTLATLLTTLPMSAPARRLGLGLLALPYAESSGAFGLSGAALCTLAGDVTFDRARAVLGELVRLGLVHYQTLRVRDERRLLCFWVPVVWPPNGGPVLVEADGPPLVAGDKCGGGPAGDLARSILSPVTSADLPTTAPLEAAGDLARSHLSPVTSGETGNGADAASYVRADARAVCLFVNTDLDPVTEQTDRQTTRAGEPVNLSPVTSADADDARIGALLTDPAINLGPAFLGPILAAKLDFERDVVGNVFCWLHERNAGKLTKPHAALANRLLNRWAGHVTDADRQSELYRRYCAPPMPARYLAPVTSAGAATAPVAQDPAGRVWAQALAAFGAQGGAAGDILAGATAAASPDLLAWRVALVDGFRLDWAQRKLAPAVAKMLAVLVGAGSWRAVTVEFCTA